MTVRPEVVSLLIDLEPDFDVPPHDWRHRDGRPQNVFEQRMADSATADELVAVVEALTLELEMTEDQLAESERLMADLSAVKTRREARS